MYVHGGYWQEKAIGRENSSFVAKALYTKKIKTVIVGYDLCPDVTLEQIIQQIKNAFRYCIDYCKQHNSKQVINNNKMYRCNFKNFQRSFTGRTFRRSSSHCLFIPKRLLRPSSGSGAISRKSCLSDWWNLRFNTTCRLSINK